MDYFTCVPISEWFICIPSIWDWKHNGPVGLLRNSSLYEAIFYTLWDYVSNISLPIKLNQVSRQH